MKLSLSKSLTILVLVSLSACGAIAQQGASVAVLKGQIAHLEKMARSVDTPAAMKASSLRLLAEKRMQLRASLRMQIDSLRKYQESYSSRFSAKENQHVADSIRSLETELRILLGQPPNLSLASHSPAVNRNVVVGASSAPSGKQLASARITSARPTAEDSLAATASDLPRAKSEATMIAVQASSRWQSGSRDSRSRDECAGISRDNYIYLDWKSGSITPSRLKRSGTYCFVLSNANSVLYDYGFTVNVLEPQGSPLGLLNQAISAIKDLVPKTAAPGPAEAPPCPLDQLLTDLENAATELETALSALLPSTSGKVASIPLETTLAAWEPVPAKFNSFEVAANALNQQLSRTPNNDLCQKQIGDAKAALRRFYEARASYLTLLSRVRSLQPPKFSDELDSTKGYDVVVRELYNGRPTEADTKTYHVTAGYSVISSSAGFLLTKVPARSYTSVTAPNPANPSTTQNVLGVDFGSGTRLALTALLHYNFPFFWSRQVGLGVTAGPVFDISGGKADTSRFGFFAGPSMRLSEWVYLTPGFHFGEFADFPQGFNAPGQVIPAGTGTPSPVKRHTTRFAFGITFKVKDLVGAGNSSSGSTPASQPEK